MLFSHLESVIDENSIRFEVAKEHSFLMESIFGEEDIEVPVPPIIETIPHVGITANADWQGYLNQVAEVSRLPKTYRSPLSRTIIEVIKSSQ